MKNQTSAGVLFVFCFFFGVDWFCVSLTVLEPDSSSFSFSLLLLIYLIVPCPWDELDTSLLPPENLLHCIKESSGHRLCPQTRFRSPEKSTQRDSFRLQCTYVCVSAFAFRCPCVCACACVCAPSCLLADVCENVCVHVPVWVYSLCVSLCQGL